jgi:hypothetical protein
MILNPPPLKMNPPPLKMNPPPLKMNSPLLTLNPPLQRLGSGVVILNPELVNHFHNVWLRTRTLMMEVRGIAKAAKIGKSTIFVSHGR